MKEVDMKEVDIKEVDIKDFRYWWEDIKEVDIEEVDIKKVDIKEVGRNVYPKKIISYYRLGVNIPPFLPPCLSNIYIIRTTSVMTRMLEI